MKKYDVIKANSLSQLIEMLKESFLTGLTALGSPAVIYMRNKYNQRIPIYYQAVAMARVKGK